MDLVVAVLAIVLAEATPAKRRSESDSLPASTPLQFVDPPGTIGAADASAGLLFEIMRAPSGEGRNCGAAPRVFL
jgi:hypothetical protein